jgi:sugar lactone lactonase YvrE
MWRSLCQTNQSSWRIRSNRMGRSTRQSADQGEVGHAPRQAWWLDGLKVDVQGNLFATGRGGVWVITPDGTHVGTIETAAKTANVGWGDDGTVLYITADKTLYRLRTATKGKLP